MPQLERTDFVFNANDPNWIANPAEPITGVSPLHGLAEQQLSNRTRGNATQLSGKSGDSGDESSPVAPLSASPTITPSA